MYPPAAKAAIARPPRIHVYGIPPSPGSSGFVALLAELIAWSAKS